MAEIGERVAGLETDMETIKHDLYGNGQPGLMSDVRDFMSQARGMAKLTIWIGIFLSILVSILTVRDFFVHKAENQVPTVAQPDVPSKQNANETPRY